MADTTLRPIQNGFETSLVQDLNTTDLVFYCSDVPDATIPSGKKVAVVLSAGTTNQEIVLVESIDTANNTMTIASGKRAQNLGNALAGTANDHTVGATVIISDDYMTFDDYGDAIDSKVNIEGDTMTGQLNFSGTDHAGIKLISLTTAQRTALTGANGMLVYDSDLGQLYQFIGGAWEAVDSGTPTPNGSTTVNGTWQGATVAEQGTATATGSTGASLLVQNQFLVKTSSGAGDENKIAVLNASGEFDVGFIPSSSLSLVPTGATFQWLTDTAPTGYLLTYGQAVSRTTYADLFAVIGTTFGVGDGSTTFNLPDLRGRYWLGKDNMGGTSANRVTAAAADTIGGTGGAETHTLTTAELPPHTHNSPYSTTSVQSGSGALGVTVSSGNATSSTGSGDAHNNMPPYITGNYIIKI